MSSNRKRSSGKRNKHAVYRNHYGSKSFGSAGAGNSQADFLEAEFLQQYITINVTNIGGNFISIQVKPSATLHFLLVNQIQSQLNIPTYKTVRVTDEMGNMFDTSKTIEQLGIRDNDLIWCTVVDGEGERLLSSGLDSSPKAILDGISVYNVKTDMLLCKHIYPDQHAGIRVYPNFSQKCDEQEVVTCFEDDEYLLPGSNGIILSMHMFTETILMIDIRQISKYKKVIPKIKLCFYDISSEDPSDWERIYVFDPSIVDRYTTLHNVVNVVPSMTDGMCLAFVMTKVYAYAQANEDIASGYEVVIYRNVSVNNKTMLFERFFEDKFALPIITLPTLVFSETSQSCILTPEGIVYTFDETFENVTQHTVPLLKEGVGSDVFRALISDGLDMIITLTIEGLISFYQFSRDDPMTLGDTDSSVFDNLFLIHTLQLPLEYVDDIKTSLQSIKNTLRPICMISLSASGTKMCITTSNCVYTVNLWSVKYETNYKVLGTEMLRQLVCPKMDLHFTYIESKKPEIDIDDIDKNRYYYLPSEQNDMSNIMTRQVTKDVAVVTLMVPSPSFSSSSSSSSSGFFR